MINVLVNAYACAPNMGSEPGMAWNWITNLAKYCNLYVITEGEWKEEIEHSMLTSDVKDNIIFYYLPVSDRIRQMCWNQGDWRFYYHYKNWQKKAFHLANKIVESESIDIVHQLNMIGFREPGYLWKIKDHPFIWGPIDAKEKFPVAYLENANLKVKSFIRIKNLLTKVQLIGSVRVKKAIKSANEVFAASSNTQETLLKYYQKESILLNETGCYLKEKEAYTTNEKRKTLNILWVGKFDFRKQLDLALLVLEKLKDLDIKIHIVGYDEGIEGMHYKTMANDLKIADKCVWYGLIPHSNVQKLMQTSDIFLFTSVAEGTPHVVLEAIGNKLPVVCFNTCGQGDVVDESVGSKIELSNLQESILRFSSTIKHLYVNRDLLQQLSDACELHQLKHSWDVKAKKMYEVYKNVLNC